MLQCIDETARSVGFAVVLGETRRDPSREQFHTGMLRRPETEGLIVLGHNLPTGVVAASEDVGPMAPIVGGCKAGRGTTPSVRIDNHARRRRRDGTSVPAGASPDQRRDRTGRQRAERRSAARRDGVARQRGIAVPGMLSVVGVDDIAFAGYRFPALTTIVQPAREMGQEAVRVLLAIIRGKPMTPVSVILRHHLIAPVAAPAGRPRVGGFAPQKWS